MKRIAAAVMFMAAAVAAHGQASGLSGTVRVMKRTLKAILALAFAATVATAQDTNFAVRISCDFQQQAGAAELPDLTLLQGSAPMIQAVPMRMGRAVSADSLTTCQLVFGPSATSTYYVATNAYLATNSAYYIQLGTIGTNSVPAGSNSPASWWYSILYYRNGGIYWSGSGRLYIERTTATGTNGLVWQEWEAGAAKDDIARGWIALLSNEVASIEVVGVNYGTNSTTAYRGDWGASVSNLAAQAAGWGDHAAAGYLTAETDAAALSAVAAVSGRVDTVESWGDHAEAGYLTAETDTAALSAVAVLRSIATVPASDAYSAPASESLPFVVTNTGTLTLSGLTDGSIGIRLTTTNASGIALYAAVVKDGVGETIASINPACDGTEQSVRWPWNASETLTIEATGIASPAEGAESAIITAVEVEAWRDGSLVGRTNDLADQHVLVDYPTTDRHAANKDYADAAAQAALDLALGEIGTATFNRDLAGYVQRWNPRFDTVADSNSLSTLYGGSTALRLDGEGAAVVPEIRAFAVESGEVATLTVWSYGGGATNLVPEVTTNLTTGTWEKKPESIVSAINIDAFTAQVVFTNDFERLLYVRLVDVSGGSGVPVFRIFGGIAFGDGEAITDWPTGGTGTGWTNLAFSGTGNAITNATAAGDTLTLERGTIEGGGGGGTADPFSSILVEADWTWTNSIYAVGANTSVTNIAITLPDAGTNFASVVVRKFSNLNQLLVVRGTNVVYTLYDDGSTRAFDWWPQRTNWFWRN